MIFSVESVADLGVAQYYLDEEGYSHIVLGHRDIKSVIITGVQETVQNPTHIYSSAYDPRRLQFLSTNVLTAHGHPMNVIIQMEESMGRVVTASPKSRINGRLIWDVLTGLYVSYDRRSDILYFSHGDSRPSYASDDENDPRIWLRFHEDDESPAGVTVFNAAEMWRQYKERLTAQVSEFLGVQPSHVESRIRNVLPSS